MLFLDVYAEKSTNGHPVVLLLKLYAYVVWILWHDFSLTGTLIACSCHGRDNVKGNCIPTTVEFQPTIITKSSRHKDLVSPCQINTIVKPETQFPLTDNVFPLFAYKFCALHR